jgi:hypothetical protein
VTATYAWVIDVDHLADEGAEPGSLAGNAATVTGPGDAPAGLLAKLAAGEGHKFRLYDDDGELYYSGRLAGDRESEDAGFGSLDDFGMPNAGATEIKYLIDGKWVTL